MVKHTPKQKLEILAAAGRILFNERWKRPMAVMLGIDKKDIWLFEQEEKEIPDGLIKKMLENVEFRIRCGENLLRRYK